MIGQKYLEYTLTKIRSSDVLDKCTVSKTVNLFHTTGSVAKKPSPEGKAFVNSLLLHNCLLYT